jgi:polar amino acid transport system substrate-binding protein
MRTAGALAGVLAAAALVASGCASEQSAAGEAFQPVKPGVLTVATAFLPAPGFWQGTPPRDGFEARFAAALADRLGLDRVEVVQVPFAKIVAGDLGGADLALSQLTPTAEREHVLDFSTPYLSSAPGVLARVGVDAADVHTLQALRWVVSRTSTLTPILEDRVHPDADPVETVDRTAALAVLRSGRADALLLDLPVAMGLAQAHPGRLHVIGQIDAAEDLAAALPNGSHNVEIVDSSIRALAADGTINRHVSRGLGQSLDEVPLIRTEA